jgi:hypothetical protein
MAIACFQVCVAAMWLGLACVGDTLPGYACRNKIVDQHIWRQEEGWFHVAGYLDIGHASSSSVWWTSYRILWRWVSQLWFIKWGRGLQPDHVADHEAIGLMSCKVVHEGWKAVLQEANGSLCGFSSQWFAKRRMWIRVKLLQLWHWDLGFYWIVYIVKVGYSNKR